MAGVAPQTQGNGGWSNVFYDAYKFWDGINSLPLPPALGLPIPRTNAEIQLNYTASQAIPYAQAPAPVPPIAIPAPAVPGALGRPLKPQPITPVGFGAEPYEKPFLKLRNGPRGIGPVVSWEMIKLLGTGGQGIVVLWRWRGPVLLTPVHSSLVVKTALFPGLDLTEEGRVMGIIGASQSEHVARLVAVPQVLTPAMCVARGLTVVWHGSVRQLVMEYCSHSTLDTLLDERIRRNIRFEEYTLWRIFECLVDGCSVLEYGTELVYNPATLSATTPAGYVPAANQTTWVHRDMKPTNVLIGNRSATHADIPVFKTADFGAAEEWNKVFAANPNLWPYQTYAGNHTGLRQKGGTRGYFTPESFHPGWNYNDYQTSPICGKFGSHTNVWQMGAIMYELACFTLGPPEVHLPYTTLHPIHGAAPSGRLYGTQLQNQPGLSNLLKDTIFECLYEVPANRASLMSLKARIRTEIDALDLNPLIVPEGYQNNELPEPVSAAQDRLAVFAVVGRPCTALKLGPGSPPCLHRVMTRLNNPRPRCWQHWDLRRWPLN